MADIANHHIANGCTPAEAIERAKATVRKEMSKLSPAVWAEWCNADAQRHRRAQRSVANHLAATVAAITDLGARVSGVLGEYQRGSVAADPDEALAKAADQLDRIRSSLAESRRQPLMPSGVHTEVKRAS